MTNFLWLRFGRSFWDIRLDYSWLRSSTYSRNLWYSLFWLRLCRCFADFWFDLSSLRFGWSYQNFVFLLLWFSRSLRNLWFNLWIFWFSGCNTILAYFLISLRSSLNNLIIVIHILLINFWCSLWRFLRFKSILWVLLVFLILIYIFIRIFLRLI